MSGGRGQGSRKGMETQSLLLTSLQLVKSQLKDKNLNLPPTRKLCNQPAPEIFTGQTDLVCRQQSIHMSKHITLTELRQALFFLVLSRIMAFCRRYKNKPKDHKEINLKPMSSRFVLVLRRGEFWVTSWTLSRCLKHLRKSVLLNGYMWFINSPELLKFWRSVCFSVFLSALVSVFKRNRFFKFVIIVSNVKGVWFNL